MTRCILNHETVFFRLNFVLEFRKKVRKPWLHYFPMWLKRFSPNVQSLCDWYAWILFESCSDFKNSRLESEKLKQQLSLNRNFIHRKNHISQRHIFSLNEIIRTELTYMYDMYESYYMIIYIKCIISYLLISVSYIIQTIPHYLKCLLIIIKSNNRAKFRGKRIPVHQVLVRTCLF